jgi:hypothetical protein
MWASLLGGLEPRFRVLFSAIFHGVPSEIAVSVENGGFRRKQNCCKLLQVYVHCLRELYLNRNRSSRLCRSWSHSPYIMAARKSPKHRELKRLVAPFDPSAPVHRPGRCDDLIAGEKAGPLPTMPWDAKMCPWGRVRLKTYSRDPAPSR